MSKCPKSKVQKPRAGHRKIRAGACALVSRLGQRASLADFGTEVEIEKKRDAGMPRALSGQGTMKLKQTIFCIKKKKEKKKENKKEKKKENKKEKRKKSPTIQ